MDKLKDLQNNELDDKLGQILEIVDDPKKRKIVIKVMNILWCNVFSTHQIIFKKPSSQIVIIQVK